MNYPQAMNELFRRVRLRDVELTPIQAFLYIALLQLANENRWQSNVVSVSNTELMRLSLITHKNTFINARLSLIKKKFIKFEPGKTDHTYSKYTLVFAGANPYPVERTDSAVSSPKSSAVSSAVSGAESPPALPIYDLNKRNEKKNTPLTPQRGGEVLKFLKIKTTTGE